MKKRAYKIICSKVLNKVFIGTRGVPHSMTKIAKTMTMTMVTKIKNQNLWLEEEEHIKVITGWV